MEARTSVRKATTHAVESMHSGMLPRKRWSARRRTQKCLIFIVSSVKETSLPHQKLKNTYTGT